MASRIVVATMLTLSAAHAQPAPSAGTRAGETSPAAAARAKEHFQRGRELYQQGSYREALDELEAAHSLDPHAKDLVFNLAVVNEKLNRLDEAVRYLQSYEQMDLEPAERTRADAYLKRLEGAKKEVAARAVDTPPVTSTTGPVTPPPPPPPPPHGRVDAATVTAAAFAVGGAAFGTVFGIKALSDDPKNLVTGMNGLTYSQLMTDQSHAHTEAILADVGIIVGVAAAALTAYLYFGRTKDKSPPPTEPTVSARPVTDGGHGAVFLVVGSF
jgi:tetratricopeptide (TPR) repeat protein